MNKKNLNYARVVFLTFTLENGVIIMRTFLKEGGLHFHAPKKSIKSYLKAQS